MAKVEHYRGLGTDLDQLYQSIKQVMKFIARLAILLSRLRCVAKTCETENMAAGFVIASEVGQMAFAATAVGAGATNSGTVAAGADSIGAGVGAELQVLMPTACLQVEIVQPVTSKV
jgi:hypothetical protein